MHEVIMPKLGLTMEEGTIVRWLKEEVVEDGDVVARPTIYLTLSVDHRVLDGATGARFLQELQTLIEDPYQVFLRDTVYSAT